MRGRSWALVVPALLLAAGLAGCGQDLVTRPGGAASGVAFDANAPTGAFVSTEVTEGAKPRQLVQGTRIGLTFTAGRISANAGCNSMSATASFSNGHLVVGELAQTDLGCPGAGRHQQDEFLAAFLGASPAYTLTGGVLDLQTTAARMVLGPREEVEPDLPLEGTRWNLTQVTLGPPAGAPADPNSSVSASAAPTGAYLQLNGDKVTGSDGCNSFLGRATVDGDAITFGPLASTRKACPGAAGPPGVLAVLSGTVRWRIGTTVLQLEHPSGAGLQLQAAPVVSPACCKPDAPARGTGAGSGGPAAALGTNPPTEVGNGRSGR